MDCYSWSLPAGPATRDGVCVFATDYGICKNCYARNGRYNFPAVLNAQHVRWAWWRSLLHSDRDKLVSTLVEVIGGAATNGYFRVFDSGDFDSPTSIEVWRQICLTLPNIRFWFPTRSWRATTQQWIQPLAELADLPNVVVRPSALDFNDDPPVIGRLGAGTTVLVGQDKGNICPKSIDHSSCEAHQCRACWNKVGEISYRYHGIYGRDKPSRPSESSFDRRTKVREEFVQLTTKGLIAA